jgi:hypothetical protein
VHHPALEELGDEGAAGAHHAGDLQKGRGRGGSGRLRGEQGRAASKMSCSRAATDVLVLWREASPRGRGAAGHHAAGQRADDDHLLVVLGVQHAVPQAISHRAASL